MFKRIPGTKDILPDEVTWWQKTEETSRKIFSKYNYLEIRPPLIEEASLFNRSLGEATEIVQKQMFMIKKDQDLYALRPEGTASIVRAYLENSLDKTHGFVKLYYIGPMFRMERPQKGRFRQFHHIGAEAIGSMNPSVDIEVISLADEILQACSIEGYRIIINSLGCPDDKKKLSLMLKDNLKGQLKGLCDDCKDRFDRNVFRILDCKNQGCQKIVQGLGIGDSYLCDECKAHFQEVKDGLTQAKVKYEVSNSLVRGLDYYTRTVFEVKHHELGSQQDALGAGGRYDNLVKELGGPDIGAMGFAFGTERLFIASKSAKEDSKQKLVYVITMADAPRKKGLEILSVLRKNGIASDTDHQAKSLKAAMRKANDAGAKFVIILGEDELKDDSVALKDMEKSTQEKVKTTELIDNLKKRIGV